MKRSLATFIPLALSLSVLSFPAQAQRAITGTGTGGGSSVGIVPSPRTEIKTITYTALTPLRQWTNSAGTTMMAHLLAHDPPGGARESSANADDPKAPPVILRDDKVRFLKDKKVFELPLAGLSAPDQEFIKALIASARQAPTPSG